MLETMDPRPQPTIKYTTSREKCEVIAAFESAHPGYGATNWWDYFRGADGIIEYSAEFRKVKSAYSMRQAAGVIAGRAAHA